MSLFRNPRPHWFIPALKFLVFSGILYAIARFFLRAAARELRILHRHNRQYGKEIFI